MQEGIYGDDEFVKMVKDKAELIKETSFGVINLVHAACDLYNIDLETLRKPGKTQKEANIRALLALIIRETPDLTLEELGCILQRDASSLSKHAARLLAKRERTEEVRSKVSELKDYVSQMSECQA